MTDNGLNLEHAAGIDVNRIGCSGFAERLWKGVFYPEDLSSKDYLHFYSRQISAVEINATFYRKPQVKTLMKWYQDTPENFEFFIKMPKAFTHIAKLEQVHQQAAEFCDYIAEHLTDKLAGFLWQLPPSFHYHAENVDKIFAAVKPDYLNVIEFRHRSWWDAQAWQVLAQQQIVFSGVSIPKDIPDDVMVNHDAVLYYRLHGVPHMFKSPYSEQFLENLAQQLQQFDGTRYVMFNNTYGTAGIQNALQLQQFLSYKR